MVFSEFKERFNIVLNEQQCEAVKATDGSVLLLAVPGSGKTTVLVTRLGYMIYCRGVAPQNILTMTYTVAATNDMRARFRSMFGDEMAVCLQFRTINGVCAKIIRSYEVTTGAVAFTLLTDEKDISSLLLEIYKSVSKTFPTESDIKNIRSLITYAKNMMLDEEEFKKLDEKEDHFSEIYKIYCSELKKRRLMDYDDQMIYAYRILQKCPDILARLHRQYPYICVDEAQDTSKIQHLIISLLAGEEGNLFMVGDEDQSIYGFRAAYPEALMNFEKDHEGARVLLMENNYRSNANIVYAADNFIQKNFFRHAKHMKPTREAGSEIRDIQLLGRKAQYTYLLKVAKSCTRETAVLYRDNENILPLADLLERENVPYRIKSADYTFFTHRIVQDVVNIIRFAYDPFNTEIFMQIYYKIGTYMNKFAATAACETSEKLGITILDAAILHGNLAQGTQRSCTFVRSHLESLVNERADNAIFRISSYLGYGDHLARMGMSANKLNILEAIGANETDAQALVERLETLKNVLSTKETQNDAKFILSTIHSSKGLEYDTVYLLDVCDGVFPESVVKSVQSSNIDEVKTYEEERRLFYVGVTRAKNELSVFTFGKGRSTFSDELLGKEKNAPENDVRTSAEAGASAKDIADFASRFKEGTRIDHKMFGGGTVIEKEDDIVSVKLDNGETKKLSLKFLLERGLLK